jgi:hypothetical protein
VIVELALDVARKIFQSATQNIEILTQVLDPQPVRLGVMTPNGVCGFIDQSAGEIFSDLVRAIVNDPSELLHRFTPKRLSS